MKRSRHSIQALWGSGFIHQTPQLAEELSQVVIGILFGHAQRSRELWTQVDLEFPSELWILRHLVQMREESLANFQRFDLFERVSMIVQQRASRFSNLGGALRIDRGTEFRRPDQVHYERRSRKALPGIHLHYFFHDLVVPRLRDRWKG